MYFKDFQLEVSTMVNVNKCEKVFVASNRQNVGNRRNETECKKDTKGANNFFKLLSKNNTRKNTLRMFSKIFHWGLPTRQKLLKLM